MRASYGSASLALAALEYLGTLGDPSDARSDLVSVTAAFDDGAVETFDPTSVPDWNAIPPGASVRFGTAWLRERRSVALGVPSMMIPSECNYVLNPDHPDFEVTVRVGEARPFAFDSRLLGR